MAMDTCSMHCGRFSGVAKDAYEAHSEALQTLFGLVEYDEESQELNLCGARGVSDLPGDLTQIFDALSKLPGDKGRGRIMINCNGAFEVCYFRHGMWKLEAVAVPPDPFDGVHYAG